MTILPIIIWPLIVITHTLIRVYLFPLYFDLTPNEKIKRRYLKTSENFKYINSYFLLKSDIDLRFNERIHYRIDIQLKGLYRALFKPLDFKEELTKLNKHIADVNCIDPHKFFEAKRKGKIFC